MKESFVNEQQLPLIIEPNGSGKSKAELLQWLNTNSSAIEKKFVKHGAILFRCFEIDSPKDFEDVAVAVDPKLENMHTYMRTSTAQKLFSGNIFCARWLV